MSVMLWSMSKSVNGWLIRISRQYIMNNHNFFSKCYNTYFIEGLAGNPFAALHGWWAGSHLWLGFSFLFLFAPRPTSQRVTNDAINICCVLAGTQRWLQNHTSLTKWRLSSCLQSPTTLQERVSVKLAMISKTNYYLCFILASGKTAFTEQICALSRAPPLCHEVSWPCDWLMMGNVIKYRLGSQCLC